MLFRLAQEKLGGGEFAQIADNVSGLDDMLAAAPAEGGGLMDAVGGMLSSFGGGSGQLGSLASLAGGFDRLGLDPGMIGKFVPVVLEFIRDRAGETAAGLLQGVLSPR
jgi:hypothetical protein